MLENACETVDIPLPFDRLRSSAIYFPDTERSQIMTRDRLRLSRGILKSRAPKGMGESSVRQGAS